MTYHHQVDDDTDCVGRLDIEKLSALRCQVKCVLCNETLEYLRAPSSPEVRRSGLPGAP